MPDTRRTVVRLALSGTLLLGLMAAAPVASAQGEPAFVPYCIDGSEWQADRARTSLWSAAGAPRPEGSCRCSSRTTPNRTS